MAEQTHVTTAETAEGRNDSSALTAGIGPSRSKEGMVSSTSPAEVGVPTFTWGGYLQGVGVMLLLLGVLWWVMRLLRRYGRFNFIPRQDSLPRDAFFMEAQMPVGPRKSLMVVRFMQRRLLLGVTEQRISLLTEERLDDDSSAESDRSFEEYMEDGGQKKSG